MTSLASYVLITVGLALWLAYGSLKGNVPLVVLTTAVAVMKLVFEKRPA